MMITVTDQMQHYKIDLHKHDWPSTIEDFSAIAEGDTPSEINASDIIPAFFEQYYRPT